MLETIWEFLFKYPLLVFQQGKLVFDMPVAPLFLGIAGAVAVTASAWAYQREGTRLRFSHRALLLTLRVAAIAVAGFCLLRPALLLSTAVPQQNYLGILLDDSRSMRVADEQGRARGEVVEEQFTDPQSDLLRALAERFQLRVFRFSDSAEPLGEGTGLTLAGDRSRLGTALDRARENLSGVPLSGLVVVSDGADNSQSTLTEPLLELQSAGVPVFTVGVGEEKWERDLELSRVATPRSVLAGASPVVDLSITHQGFGGETVQLLVEDEGRIISSQDVRLPRNGEAVSVRVQFTASEPGARRFRFRIPQQRGERVSENNQRDALILVRDAREKILYFEGEPRFEVKFMRRAVADDENLQLVVLQRTAENKFLRLDVDSAGELSGGFPQTREDLFAYRGLVIGSVEASFFSHEQLRMIADFASRRGGGLLFLGGRRAFAEGGYAGTAIADALPVALDPPQGDDATYFLPLEVSPTRAGATHPAVQLAADQAASLERWQTLPPLSSVNRTGALKPGAVALLGGSWEGVPGSQTVLAYQRYGRGLSLAFPVQDSWIWQMHASIPLEDMTHETLWRQLLRWLVSATPRQVRLSAPSGDAAPGEPVRLLAEVEDESYLAVNNAAVVAEVLSPSGERIDVSMVWSPEIDGSYRASFTPGEQGRYEIRVLARQDDQALGGDTIFLDAVPSTREFFDAQMNAALLRRIADETGGRFHTTASMASLPEEIRYTGAGITMVEEKELWDMPILFLLLVGLVATEWSVRRARGLP